MEKMSKLKLFQSRRTLVLDFDAQISKFRAHWLEESKEAERLCLEVADVRAQSERIGIIEREASR